MRSSTFSALSLSSFLQEILFATNWVISWRVSLLGRKICTRRFSQTWTIQISWCMTSRYRTNSKGLRLRKCGVRSSRLVTWLMWLRQSGSRTRIWLHGAEEWLCSEVFLRTKNQRAWTLTKWHLNKLKNLILSLKRTLNRLLREWKWMTGRLLLLEPLLMITSGVTIWKREMRSTVWTMRKNGTSQLFCRQE